MKLILQSDDFGATTGVTYGTIDAIAHSPLRCTGMFVNTQAAPLAAQLIQAYRQICLGLDFNLVCGPCVADKELLPHLVDEHGIFQKTKKRYSKVELAHLKEQIEQEVEIEINAQYEKFIALLGHVPAYLHEHAKGQEPFGYIEAIRALSKKTEIPFTLDILDKLQVKGMSQSLKNSLAGKPYTISWQIENDPLAFFQEHGDELLQHEISFLRVHAGFVDQDLLNLSTYNIMRAKDHAFLVSPYLKQWIQKHQVEIISYRELVNIEKGDI